MRERQPGELPEDVLKNPYLHSLLTPPYLKYKRILIGDVHISPSFYRIENQPPELWPF